METEEQAGKMFLEPVEEEPPLIVKEGVLVFVGELEGNPDEAIEQDRADRTHTLAELYSVLSTLLLTP